MTKNKFDLGFDSGEFRNRKIHMYIYIYILFFLCLCGIVYLWKLFHKPVQTDVKLSNIYLVCIYLSENYNYTNIELILNGLH